MTQAHPQVPVQPQVAAPARYESSDEYSEESESEADTSADSAHAKHPYYRQWKEYYAAVAAQKQGNGPRQTFPAGPAPSPPAAHFYSLAPGSDNNLVRASRRSTLRSSRSSSVPLLAPRTDAPKPRAISVNVTVPPQNLDDSFDEQHEDSVLLQSSQPHETLGAANFKPVAYGLLSLAAADSDQISDYCAYLNSDSLDTLADVTLGQPVDTENVLSGPDGVLAAGEKAGKSFELANPTSIPTAIEDSPEPRALPKAARPHPLLIQTDSGPVSAVSKDNSPDGLNRQSSTASTSSYNSLQSEKELIVGRNPNRVATPAANSLRSNGRFSKPTFMPPMPGPPPPMPGAQYSESPSPMMDPQDNRRHSMGNIQLHDPMSIQQMQQQILQLQHLQHMQLMQFPVYLNGNGYGSPPLQPPRSTDTTINKRIEEFVNLRRLIASGKKSFDYRLQWMKMLMVATNFKLYAYINIKGEAITSDQVASNKQFFIKSSVTHLQKLLRELDGSRTTGYEKTFAEACFLHASLLMHDHVEKYNQDFGVDEDSEEAERFLFKCLELHPGYFKAHFKLGELYEREQTEEKFDLALEHYMESAKMGYNRAIYKVALVLLMVPKERTTKFFKYLKSLSDIDMNSKDIQLSGTDRDELEEVVGLALYQLGKIYEGIYPGDLTPEDDFVKESLELAPVNYAKSLSYYNRSAKLHCLLAQVRLGHVYEGGDLNRTPNANKSIQWFIKASTSPLKFKRHPEAILGISRWFMKGSDGANKHIPYADPACAVQWCERACKEFKYPEAFYQMGLYAEQGLVDGSPDEWFAEAARLGHVLAGEKMGS